MVIYKNEDVSTITLAAPWGRLNAMSAKRGIMLKVHCNLTVNMFYPIMAFDKSDDESVIKRRRAWSKKK